MRIEPLCKITMHYSCASWHQPYGEGASRGEALGFGHGGGEVTGDIEGTLIWALV